MPGVSADTSNAVPPAPATACTAASSSTRTDCSFRAPAVPVTWGATSTLSAPPSVSTTVKDWAVIVGVDETRTTSGRAVTAPRMSATVAVSSTTSVSGSEAVGC